MTGVEPAGEQLWTGSTFTRALEGEAERRAELKIGAGAGVTPAGPAAPALVCGRGDCDEPATVVRLWRSGSGRRWRSTVCAEHEVDRDPISALPGFVYVDEQRVETGHKDPSQVG